ncbi:amidohydrolase family protein [Paenibacillus arenosi]|uniref:Amidohydrolase family protein n=1 Tax=Paenibacillus arenosi TaxID=2774142 RepID=A0ABR9AT59_9BACL|nr:amidohydrolase family protein [Paenibacillus arenosi]MBD8497295.1 amidohydrolase family protein [Paenibacillus arenosi]
MSKNVLFKNSIMMLIVIMISGVLAHTTYSLLGPPSPKGKSDLIIQDVTVVDVNSGKLTPKQSIIITSNKIARIDDTANIDVPDNARIIKASGKYVIPGLWDMHVHMEHFMDSAVPLLLANGVTGVREMGTSLNHVKLTQKMHNKGTLMPRIAYSGKVINKFPNDQVPPHHFSLKTEAEARKAVQLLKQHKVDHVKMYSYMPENLYTAVIDEAKKLNLPVSGHLPLTVRADQASNDGMRSFEHLHGMHIATASQKSGIFNRYLKEVADGALDKDHLLYYDYEIKAAEQYNAEESQNLFEIFKQNDTFQVPTLVTMTSTVKPSPDQRIKYVAPAIQKQWLAAMKRTQSNKREVTTVNKMVKINSDLIRKMNQAGVPIMAGSDTTYMMPNLYYGFSLHEELQLLVKAGLSPLEALQSATINPARYLNSEHKQGTVEEGKLADLVILDANPLTDIRNTTRIHAVVVNGHLLDHTKIKSMVKTYPVINEFSRKK